MSMVYEDTMVRLKEERLIHKLSQEKLSSQLRITQGHYSKAEQGIKRFTYYEMKCLANSELDLYGRKHELEVKRYRQLLSAEGFLLEEKEEGRLLI